MKFSKVSRASKQVVLLLDIFDQVVAIKLEELEIKSEVLSTASCASQTKHKMLLLIYVI